MISEYKKIIKMKNLTTFKRVDKPDDWQTVTPNKGTHQRLTEDSYVELVPQTTWNRTYDGQKDVSPNVNEKNPKVLIEHLIKNPKPKATTCRSYWR